MWSSVNNPILKYMTVQASIEFDRDVAIITATVADEAEAVKVSQLAMKSGYMLAFKMPDGKPVLGALNLSQAAAINEARRRGV